MPLTPRKQLAAFTSPVMVAVEDGTETTDRLGIKGFASVATEDRSGDRVDPFEFNIKEFMAAPTLLRDHKFWVDEMGNHVAVGRVLSMYPAELRRNPDDKENWIVWDLVNKKKLTTFPKAKVPSLRHKSRGLFVTAEVTVQAVIKQVLAGELGGMSWRGLVVIDSELDPVTNTVIRVLRDIDLYEISITHIPDHNQSTFMVGKSVDGKFEEVEGANIDDVELWKVELSKSQFPSEGMAREFLKLHKLEESMTETDDSFVAEQRPASDFDLDKTVRVKMADAYMWLAPPVEKPIPQVNYSRLVAQLVDVDVAKSIPLQGDVVMSETNDTAATDAAKLEADKLDVEKKAKAALELEAKEKAAFEAKEKAKKAKEADKSAHQKSAEDQLVVLGNAVAVSVAESLKPTFEALAVGLTGLKDAVQKMAAGAVAAPTKTVGDGTTETETKATVEKSAAEVLGGLVAALNTVVDNQNTQQTQIAEIAKAAVALNESIPNAGIERTETVPGKPAAGKTEVEKSASDDPNACLDGAFPFLLE